MKIKIILFYNVLTVIQANMKSKRSAVLTKNR